MRFRTVAARHYPACARVPARTPHATMPFPLGNDDLAIDLRTCGEYAVVAGITSTIAAE